MSRDKRSPEARAAEHPVKIRWPARLQPALLGRLYEADAKGIVDEALVDAVGVRLYARCTAFCQTMRREVNCPLCRSVFIVRHQGITACSGCEWHTTWETYVQSMRRHYLHPGRAGAAFVAFCETYPKAMSRGAKMIAIDQLIHAFHLDEKTNHPVKSVASKLLEGNRKDVVRFLDALSSREGTSRDQWRRIVSTTIDASAITTNK